MCNYSLTQQKRETFRVERFVTSPLPHRPVRAAFPHTVPLKSDSLNNTSDKFWDEIRATTPQLVVGTYPSSRQALPPLRLSHLRRHFFTAS
jgi:hypothetical protein